MSTPISSSFTTLHSLASLITSSLTTLESTCTSLNIPWFALDDPVYASKSGGPSKEDVARMQNDAIARASATLVGAAMQLVSSVQDPGMTALRTGLGVSRPFVRSF
jgi:hypothetical protein